MQNSTPRPTPIQRNPFHNVSHETHTAPSFGDHADLGRCVDALLSDGCAIIFGKTRDGGAVVLTVLDGDDRHKTYCSDDAELEAALAAIASLYGDL